MSYTTHNLKYNSYDAFYADCEQNNLVSDGEIITSSHNHCFDLIGTLYSETGVTLTDGDGNEYAEKEAIAGYHVNLRCKEFTGLESSSIAVNSPSFAFA